MEQQALRDEYLAFLLGRSSNGVAAGRAGHPLYRDCDPGHLTASAIIVDPVGQRVLLTLHKVVGRWLQTGGHIEPADGSLMAAALREAREESGIDQLELVEQPLRLDRHLVPCRTSDGERRVATHFDVQFCAVTTGSMQETRSAESIDLRWWPWDELPSPKTGGDPSVEALVHAARARLSG